MRIAYLVALTGLVSIPAHAAPLAPGLSPKPIPFLKPLAAIHRLHGQRGAAVPPGRRYTSGFFGPYVAYPAVAAEESRAPTVVAGPAVTHNYVWHGRIPIRQGDPGYVTRPAVYDVQQELVRYQPHRRGPAK